MKRVLPFYIYPLLLLVLGLTSCSSNDDDGLEPYVPEEGKILIDTYYVRDMWIRLLDITEKYDQISYVNGNIPIEHHLFNSLPEKVQEIAKDWGLSFPTTIVLCEWKGNTIYHLSNLLYDSHLGIVNGQGERVATDADTYQRFLDEVTNARCILILEPETVRSIKGAQNLLVGTWQMNWETLHIYSDKYTDYRIPLYDFLPFKITEICHFGSDGKGYLRTIKTYKDGHNEVAYDPFTYKLTDYKHREGEGLDHYGVYYYDCYYEAGDTIEYYVRSRDDFNSFDRSIYVINYPFYKTDTDPYIGRSGATKYKTPASEASNPIVGRWKHGNTCFLFRQDNTGYRLNGNSFSGSFVYSIAYEELSGGNAKAKLNLYYYDKGFYETDFYDDGLPFHEQFSPTKTPDGLSTNATLFDDGDKLKIDAWTTRNSEGKVVPATFSRVMP